MQSNIVQIRPERNQYGTKSPRTICHGTSNDLGEIAMGTEERIPKATSGGQRKEWFASSLGQEMYVKYKIVQINLP
jgi:hypothetical protein